VLRVVEVKSCGHGKHSYSMIYLLSENLLTLTVIEIEICLHGKQSSLCCMISLQNMFDYTLQIKFTA